MRTIVIIVLAIVVAGVAYLFSFPGYSWHQKMTVTVSTPEGERTGSSVISASVSYGPTFGLPEAAGGNEGWHGEGVVVELPAGRYLFVLIGDPLAMAQDSFKAAILGDENARIKNVSEYYSILQTMRLSAPVARKRYPMMVTFRNLEDPASVTKVDPHNLSATFGKSYSLASMELEITDEQVTWGRVDAVLGWINNNKLRKNPIWGNLPPLMQKTLSGIKLPKGGY